MAARIVFVGSGKEPFSITVDVDAKAVADKILTSGARLVRLQRDD